MTDYSSQPASAASAKDKAADVAQTGKQAASEVAQTANNAAKDVAQVTKDQASDLYVKTKSQLGDQVVTQKSALVDTLRSLGDQLAAMTDHVDESGTAVDIASKARDQAHGAADWLDRHEPNEVLDELRGLGRQQPGKFLLGAFVAGVAAGRLTRGTVAVHTADDEETGATAKRPAPNGQRPYATPTLPPGARHAVEPTPDVPSFAPSQTSPR